MATPAQVAASRANAQLSTGPRSVEGKAIASRNSLKLGITAQSMIIPGEDPAELEQLAAEYYEEFQPVGPIETALVDSIVRAQWMERRSYRIEAAFIKARVAELENPDHALGAVIAYDGEHGDTYHKIFRRRQAVHRECLRAMETLARLQAQRIAAQPQPVTPGPATQPRSAAPPRVRFDDPPQPLAPHAPEPPVNLALRL